jgi:dipeptidyl-peptidase 4
MIKIKSIFSTIVLLALIISVQAQKKITIENIFTDREFSQKSVYGLLSMNDGVSYSTQVGDSKIVKYSYKTGNEIETIYELSDDLKDNMIYEYFFSSDESKMLFSVNPEEKYRYSYYADYYVADLKTGETQKLFEDGEVELAEFSTDGNKIAFVYKNNLYYRDLTINKIQQITTDGKWNHIINGAPDWVYEEEFGFNYAYKWSPDGNKIAYYKFDESHVKTYNMTMYNELYPNLYSYKYPKPGEDNSIVTIHIFNLETKKSINAEIGEETDQYIPRIMWTKDPNTLALYRMNRLQNKLELLFVDGNEGSSEVILTEESKWYVNVNDDLTFLNDGENFIYSSVKSGYQHLYLYNMKGEELNQITKGNWNVTSYSGFNEKTGKIYYTSNEESVIQRDVYEINLDGTEKRKLSTKPGTSRASFSSGYKYYIIYHSSGNTPYYISLYNIKGKLIRVLEENKEVLANMEEYGFSKRENFTFKTSEDVELNGYIIKPLDFDENEKYPLFMFQYSGPGSQRGIDAWSRYLPWFNYLAQNGYIVACVDGRGTGFRSEEFEKMTYMQMGKLEAIDQTEAAKYLGAKDYIDANRIGIFGWSYGGYMSSLCLFKSPEIFKMAIAVAPVTNWRYYDNIYTERFMRTPQENAEGYDKNSPINFVDKMEGELLLIHGSADDNVHFQNTMEMVKKLVEEKKQFDLFVYPNKNHFMLGTNTKIHLYTKMSNFIFENL